MNQVVLFADYFGRKPDWFSVFLLSCAANPAIVWIVHTDIDTVGVVPSNVTLIRMASEEYCEFVSMKLSISFRPFNMYNICNIRPAMGDLFKDNIADATHFGWCDVDVIFGDISSYLTEEVLRHDVISFSGSICSGHMSLLRNTREYREMYRAIPGWQKLMSSPWPIDWNDSVDESWLSVLCSPRDLWRNQYYDRGFTKSDCIDQFRNNTHFEEQWTTPFMPIRWHNGRALHPEVWYWEKGNLSNCDDNSRSFPYLHLMNFRSPRYVRESLYGHCVTWDNLHEIFQPSALSAEVIRISRLGICGISRSEREAEMEQFRRWRMSGASLRFLKPAEIIDASPAFGVKWVSSNRYADLAGALVPEVRRHVAAYLGSY